ncbi:MAG: flagellar basal-body MS-ring/collar protein FliF [Actinomycetota bacterium]
MSDQSTSAPLQDRVRSDFSSFTVPQYLALGLMAVAVVILGMWFMQWSSTPSWEVVASGLAPGDAASVSDDLDTEGIEHRLVNGGTAVEVPSSAAAQARVAIGESPAGAGGGEGYELLDNQGFLASSFSQRVNYQRAIEGELARTIMAMDNVTSAIVHVAIPEDRLFADDEPATRASVVVGGRIDQGTVASIANVVGSAIPGLDPMNVTVADTNGRVLNGGETDLSGDMQLQAEDLYEAQLELNAQSMLAAALGPGRAVVRVSADLNFDELEQETLTYDADTQVTLRQQELDEAFTGDNSVPLGTLGTAEEVTDAGDLAGEDGSAYIRQETNSEFGVPSTRTVSRQAPGRVERLSVAVLVDDTVEPAPDPAQLSTLVAAAVGIDPERGDSIVVESLTFDEVAIDDLEAAPLTPAAAGGGLEPMLGYARTGAAVLGLLLALLALRKGMKTLAPVTREPVDIDPAKIAELTAAGEGEGSEDGETTEVTAGAAAATAAAGGGTAAQLALGAGVDGGVPSEESVSTVDMLELIDQQSDEVALMLRDLVAESA